MTGTKVEAIHHHGVPSAERFVVGRVLEAEQHPDADRLKVCTVDLGDERRQPGDDRLRRAERRGRADGRRGAPGRGDAGRDEARSRRSCAACVSEGMILAERAELELGARARAGIMVLDELDARRRARAGHAARRRAADRDGRARARDHAQPAGLPRRVRRRARAARRHAARRWRPRRGARTPARRARSRAREVTRRVPRAVPALHRARVRGRHDRARRRRG